MDRRVGTRKSDRLGGVTGSLIKYVKLWQAFATTTSILISHNQVTNAVDPFGTRTRDSLLEHAMAISANPGVSARLAGQNVEGLFGYKIVTRVDAKRLDTYSHRTFQETVYSSMCGSHQESGRSHSRLEIVDPRFQRINCFQAFRSPLRHFSIRCSCFRLATIRQRSP